MFGNANMISLFAEKKLKLDEVSEGAYEVGDFTLNAKVAKMRRILRDFGFLLSYSP